MAARYCGCKASSVHRIRTTMSSTTTLWPSWYAVAGAAGKQDLAFLLIAFTNLPNFPQLYVFLSGSSCEFPSFRIRRTGRVLVCDVQCNGVLAESSLCLIVLCSRMVECRASSSSSCSCGSLPSRRARAVASARGLGQHSLGTPAYMSVWPPPKSEKMTCRLRLPAFFWLVPLPFTSHVWLLAFRP